MNATTDTASQQIELADIADNDTLEAIAICGGGIALMRFYRTVTETDPGVGVARVATAKWLDQHPHIIEHRNRQFLARKHLERTSGAGFNFVANASDGDLCQAVARQHCQTTNH